MELSLRKEKKVNYPSKTTINFISDEQRKNDRMALIGFAIFMAILPFFVIFGVIQPLRKVNDAESVYNMMESKISGLKSELSNYDAVQAEYNEVIGSFLTETELSYLDRMGIIKMVEEDIKANIDIKSISISGNTVRVSTDAATMDIISSIVDILNNDKRNSYVNVTTTKANKDVKDMVYADIIVAYSGVK